jgi:hypothetical protein
MFILLLVLRLLHILAGVIWASIAFYNAFFALPPTPGFDPNGGKLMRHLSVTRKFTNVLPVVSTTTVLTWVVLLFVLSEEFSAAWFSAMHWSVLLFAASCALTAYGIFFVLHRPKDGKIQNMLDVQQLNTKF